MGASYMVLVIFAGPLINGTKILKKMKHWLHFKDILFLHVFFQVTCDLYSISGVANMAFLVLCKRL
jgi:hypothetical protein